MIAKINYLGGLRTEATHLKSGTVLHTDAPEDNQGLGRSFSPTDLAATSLGSCILTIMGIAAQTHEIDITGTAASIYKTMSTSPRRIAHIKVEIKMPDRDYTLHQRKIIERAAHHCPVALSLGDQTEEEIVIVW